MQKIEVIQGDSKFYNMLEIVEFPWLRPSPGSKLSSGKQNRVLTHSVERSKWLEELASESNTIQAQGHITRPGRLELQTQ